MERAEYNLLTLEELKVRFKQLSDCMEKNKCMTGDCPKGKKPARCFVESEYAEELIDLRNDELAVPGRGMLVGQYTLDKAKSSR